MAKREKKNNKKRLLLLIVLLVLTVVMLSSATYAWFISNKTVSVDSLDVQARTSNGLEISADAVNWGVSINKANLISNSWAGHRNQLPKILDHVSTVGNLHTDAGQNYMELFDGNVAITCDGTVADDGSCEGTEFYTLTTKATNEINCYDENGEETVPDSSKCNGKTYMAFDIFLKVTNDADLYLGRNATVKKKGDNSFGIENAVRVAFLYRGHLTTDEYYTDDASEGEALAQELNASANDDDPAVVYIWEPNYDAHTAAGVASGRNYFNVNTISTGTGNAQVEYYGVKTAWDDPIDLTKTAIPSGTGALSNFADLFELVEPDIITASGHDMQITPIKLKAGVTKFRVYFWVEGQDVDTENLATGHDMSLNIELSIN